MIISIKPAETAHIPEMSHVVSAAWKDAYKDLITKKDMDKFTCTEYRQDSFSHIMKNGYDVFVLICDGKVGGVCSVCKCVDKRYQDTVVIEMLYILPQWHNIGFGRKLLSHTLREMRKKGYKKAVLWLLEGNENAECFYRKFGFKQTGKKEKIESFENQNLTIQFEIEL